MRQSSLYSSRRGLTLLELLVVLVILATLATIAITSTTGLADQARYEATQRTLMNVHDAILGPPSLIDTDGTPIRTGFVADMGRLPQAVSVPLPNGGGNVLTLGELLGNTTGMQAYTVQPASTVGAPTGFDSASEADPNVYLGTGWRGPYVQMPPGETQLRDGWGVPFVTPSGSVSGYPYNLNNHLLDANGNAVASTTAVAQILSFGSDDKPTGGSGTYNVTITTPTAPITASDYQSQITVTVEVTSVSGSLTVGSSVNLEVRLFSPDGNNGGLFVTPLELTATVGSVNQVSFTANFSTSTIPAGSPTPTAGPRALRAYYGGASTPVTSSPSSPIAYFTARPGQNFRTLYINVP